MEALSRSRKPSHPRIIDPKVTKPSNEKAIRISRTSQSYTTVPTGHRPLMAANAEDDERVREDSLLTVRSLLEEYETAAVARAQPSQGRRFVVQSSTAGREGNMSIGRKLDAYTVRNDVIQTTQVHVSDNAPINNQTAQTPTVYPTRTTDVTDPLNTSN